MRESTRRLLVKRLAAIAVAGYVAPKVATIKPAQAKRDGHGGGHHGGPPCCAPPCHD